MHTFYNARASSEYLLCNVMKALICETKWMRKVQPVIGGPLFMKLFLALSLRLYVVCDHTLYNTCRLSYKYRWWDLIFCQYMNWPRQKVYKSATGGICNLLNGQYAKVWVYQLLFLWPFLWSKLINLWLSRTMPPLLAPTSRANKYIVYEETSILAVRTSYCI